MEKIKVIQTAHSSESYSLGAGEKDLKKIVLNNWPAKVSRQIKKYYPEIEVECWAPDKIYKKEERYEDSGVLFRFFPTTIALKYALDVSMPMIRELKKEVEKSKKQGYKLIIHVHEVHNLHGLLFASMFKNDNVIVQHHGAYWPLRHLKETKEKRLFFLFFLFAQGVENLILKNIKLYYILTKPEGDYLRKVAPNSKFRLQTMGIEDEYFNKVDKKTARKKLNLPLDKKIILFIGRIAEIKGMGYLLKAMKDLKDVQLINIGFSPEEPKFKAYAKENNLDNVNFLGGVFGEKKLLYLSAADLLVLPSLKEGAPVTVMEALGKNTPVVVSNVGGVELMIENGREGVIIKQKDVKDIVRGVREVLKWKNKEVQQYAEKYKWKSIIHDTVEDYRKF
ncbi:MAG: glycosyltransferase family 4 protein [archaeon]